MFDVSPCRFVYFSSHSGHFQLEIRFSGRARWRQPTHQATPATWNSDQTRLSGGPDEIQMDSDLLLLHVSDDPRSRDFRWSRDLVKPSQTQSMLVNESQTWSLCEA
ncbi:hypothetical protein L1987_23148 [Smallanthus sonchifolius]|uniref:Uncharacterized protein n=1 Tax=Smallanthus sonchifolius TaxID=185202 RepID=A0ACB9IHR1_9ASTR|nr:hypothetical protein L1987_23148 [Smallanthus sonchifolius]